MTRIRHVVALAVTSTCLAPAALGDLITYTVDPARSFLTLSGTANGIPIQPEPLISGSLATPYAGTVSADRDFVTDTAQIMSASIAAQNIGATLRADGSPANYGFIAPTTDASGLGYWGAILNLDFSFASGLIGSLSSFDPSALSVTSTGEMEYGNYAVMPHFLSGASISLPAVLVLQPGSASFSQSAGVDTLTLPIESDFTLELNGLGSTYPFDGHLTGTIVATTAVPEPASLALLGIPLLFMRRRF